MTPVLHLQRLTVLRRWFLSLIALLAAATVNQMLITCRLQAETEMPNTAHTPSSLSCLEHKSAAVSAVGFLRRKMYLCL